MEKSSGHDIEKVSPGSPAYAADIRPGWKLHRIDNQQIGDIIDYKIMESDDRLRLLVQDEAGIFRRIRIIKPPETPLGLYFTPPTISIMHYCVNRCIFCFVEQNPTGMRPALYIKDDDYRLSFLYGNFITLNRLTEPELERIIRLQLSPLYVSVHTTNPDLRRVMFGTKKAEKGLINLARLVDSGIRIHAQVVLCPGFNTGSEMERTISDLSTMGSNLTSIALVPIGLTGHRCGLEPLRKFEPREAAELVEKISVMQRLFLKERGSRFVFLADEFYNLAGAEYPADSEYEGYPQLENGVGLARNFLNELALIEQQEALPLAKPFSVTIAAGQAASSLMELLAAGFSSIDQLSIRVEIVKNEFFGDPVTVSGLLTGSDLIAALKGKDLGDAVFISETLLKDESNFFLDDLTVNEVESALNASVYAVNGPLDLHSKIRGIAGK